MARFLDAVALVLLTVSAAVLVGSVWLVAAREDFAALFALAAGIVMMRSSVDLLRPGRSK